MEYFIIEKKDGCSNIKVTAQEIVDKTIDGKFIQEYR